MFLQREVNKGVWLGFTKTFNAAMESILMTESVNLTQGQDTLSMFLFSTEKTQFNPFTTVPLHPWKKKKSFFDLLREQKREHWEEMG